MAIQPGGHYLTAIVNVSGSCQKRNRGIDQFVEVRYVVLKEKEGMRWSAV